MEKSNEPPRIKFEGDTWQQPAQFSKTKTPKIIRQIIIYSGGYIKNEKQASYVLMGFVIVAILISLFLFFGSSGELQPAPSDY